MVRSFHSAGIVAGDLAPQVEGCEVRVPVRYARPSESKYHASIMLTVDVVT